MSLDNISTELLLYFMLYGASAMTALIVCIYLLFRKSNAISPDVTPPMPKRPSQYSSLPKTAVSAATAPSA